MQGLFTPCAGNQHAYAPAAGLTNTNLPQAMNSHQDDLPLTASYGRAGTGSLAETKRFKDRMALDGYLRPYLIAGVILPGEIEGYRWKVIRNQQQPDNYTQHLPSTHGYWGGAGCNTAVLPLP